MRSADSNIRIPSFAKSPVFCKISKPSKDESFIYPQVIHRFFQIDKKRCYKYAIFCLLFHTILAHLSPENRANPLLWCPKINPENRANPLNPLFLEPLPLYAARPSSDFSDLCLTGIYSRL